MTNPLLRPPLRNSTRYSHRANYQTKYLKPISASKLLLACKLVSSGGEAKRMIKQSAAGIDGKKLDDPNAEITPKDGMVIRVGKRKFAKLKTTSF